MQEQTLTSVKCGFKPPSCYFLSRQDARFVTVLTLQQSFVKGSYVNHTFINVTQSLCRYIIAIVVVTHTLMPKAIESQGEKKVEEEDKRLELKLD